MAKEMNAENDLVHLSLERDRRIWWFDRDGDPFLQSLEDKQDAALLLSTELAVWFGDLSSQSPPA